MNWSIQKLLSPDEIAYFQNIYISLDPLVTNHNSLLQQNIGKINSKDSVSFFKRSGLPVSDLKQIWQVAASNSDGIDRNEFFVALKLISYAQNGIEISEKSILSSIPSPMPKINGIEIPAPIQQYNQMSPQYSQPSVPDIYELIPSDFEKYSNFYITIDKNGKGFVTGQEAKQIFSKSNLPIHQLGEIWQMCDSNGKGYLFKGEFIVAVHLIGLCKKNIQLPTQLPECLQKYFDQQPPIQQNLLPGPAQPSTPQSVNQNNTGLYQPAQKMNSVIIPQQQQIIQPQNQLNSQQELYGSGISDSQFQMEQHLMNQLQEQSQKLSNQLQVNQLGKVKDNLTQMIEDKKKLLEFLEQIHAK